MMKIYLDDDSASPLLAKLLARDGYDVVIPGDVGNRGIKDPAHFLFAFEHGRVLLTHNHDDFEVLHRLILGTGGHHLGLLVVRKDNDAKRDLRPQGIVRALRKFLSAGLPVADELIILNLWR
jgi:predicted nuclease of predicted toxin-antitoxin system